MIYTPKKIFELYEEWKNYMHDSWERGHDNLKSVYINDTYKDSKIDEKEVIVFNIVVNLLKKAQAYAKDIDLSLLLSSPYCDDTTQERTFRLLINQLMLTEEHTQAFSAALDKVYDFGQAVMMVKPVREDNKTLNSILKIDNVEDPTTCFFDKKVQSKNFNSGRFCGQIQKISSKNLSKRYPKIKNKLDGDCDVNVIDFWYKSQYKCDYIKLNSGIWKRVDLIMSNDMVDQLEKPRKGTATCINYLRVAEGVEDFLEKEKSLPYHCFPLVLDTGNMIWTGEQYESFPLGYYLKDPQILLNYIASCMADFLKSSTVDKLIVGPEHVRNQKGKDTAKNFVFKGGVSIFDGDLAKINHIPAQQMPPYIAQLFVEVQKSIQTLAGAYFDENSSELKSISGVALDKIYSNQNLQQNNTLSGHIHAINHVGRVLQQMIPAYYIENRIIMVKNDGGDFEKIEINTRERQTNGLIVITNNIKDLSNKYEYQIKVAPSLDVQNKNTKTELLSIYQVYPNAIPATIDIYAKSLDIASSDLLAKRLGATVNPDLIEYGKGNITRTAFDKKMQESKQEQKQEAMNSPEAKFMEAKTQSEQSKAQSDQSKAQTDSFNAQTARIKETTAAHTAELQLTSDNIKSQNENQIALSQQKLEYIKTELQHMNAMLENK